MPASVSAAPNRRTLTHRFATVWMLTALVCLPLLSCTQDMRDGIRETVAIQQAVTSEFGLPSVKIHIQNGRELGLTLENSHYNGLSSEQRRVQAIKVARFAKSKLDKLNSIETIWVKYVIYEKKYLIVDYTETLETFYFRVQELQDAFTRS